MKFSLFLLLAMSVSCGRYDVVGGTSATVGETHALSIENLSSGNLNALSQICTALASKTATINSAIGSTFTFNASQSDCDGTVISSGDVQTYVQSSGSSFVFRRKADNSDFFFSDVETPATGTMGAICGSLINQKGTVVSGSEATTFRASDVLSTDCPPAMGEICFYVEKGTVQTDSNNNSTVKIHTKEWIRFRTSSTEGKVGFFTFRKRVAQSYCAQNKAQVLSATLK